MMYDTTTSADDAQVVTALFDHRESADKARADLLAAGFPAEAIRYVEGAAAANLAKPAKDAGFFESLLEIFVFMPKNDRVSFEEAVRRGGVALAVHTSRDAYERAIDILDRDGAIDLDERETAWRSEGWTDTPAVSAPHDAEMRAFETTNAQDKLVNPEANPDMRERIGVGTADQTVGADLAPGNAITEPTRTAIPGEDESSVTSRRDTDHGRRRVRSYIGGSGAVPTGIDPQI